MSQRKIIHIDMDAFFASVEQRDNPALQGKPVIVGGKPDSRGVVAACSYEARKFGIHSAMPCSRAQRLCPNAIFVRPRFEAYRSASQKIHAVFREFTPLIEPLSLDEAYLDVSDCKAHQGSATRIAQTIKSRILATTSLTASAGVSYNKFLAKIASDLNKPDGLAVIRPEQGETFVAELPVGKFFGVGKVTEKRMHELDIYTGADLRECSLAKLQKFFGKSAHYFHQISCGLDNRPVSNQRQRKSIGAETTFATDLRDVSEMLVVLKKLAERVAQSLEDKQLQAKTITLKVKFHDFKQVTRSQSVERPLTQYKDLQKWLSPLLARTQADTRSVRLLGVAVSGLLPRESADMQQLELM